jgi:PIN domain nuclease of toxin-antitoxin system
MILLDTHIWIWWVNGSAELPDLHKSYIDANVPQGLGVSIMSCWEVASLVRKNRLNLGCATLDWINLALNYPGISLLNLNSSIVVDANDLPGAFHRDPVDCLLVATARFSRLSLLTLDTKILEYPHVNVWKTT